MRHLLPLVAAVLPLVAAPAARAQGPALPERVLVDGDEVRRIRFEGIPWQRAKQGLSSSGDPIWADELLSTSDGGVHLRLRLEAFEGSGAALKVGGAYIILDGPDGHFAVEGEWYGSRLQKLAPIAEHAKPGKPFDLQVTRLGGALSIVVAGSNLSTIDIGSAALGEVGVIPGRARLSIERFALLGSTVPPPPPAGDPVLQGQVEAAIQRGVLWLLRHQMADGTWGMM
ncbi:MAG: hypothetical protein RL112_249, partial [Planctomycetota bacterium]